MLGQLPAAHTQLFFNQEDLSPPYKDLGSVLSSFHTFYHNAIAKGHSFDFIIKSFLKKIRHCHLPGGIKEFNQYSHAYISLYEDIYDLLLGRQDILRKYMPSPIIGESDINHMLNIYANDIPVESLFCVTISEEGIEAIKESMIDLDLVSPENHGAIDSFLQCIGTTPLLPKNNGRIAYFIRALKDRMIFKGNIFAIIERQRLLLSSKGGKILNSENMTKAADQYARKYEDNDCVIISKAVSKLRQELESKGYIKKTI